MACKSQSLFFCTSPSVSTQSKSTTYPRSQSPRWACKSSKSLESAYAEKLALCSSSGNRKSCWLSLKGFNRTKRSEPRTSHRCINLRLALTCIAGAGKAKRKSRWLLAGRRTWGVDWLFFGRRCPPPIPKDTYCEQHEDEGDTVEVQPDFELIAFDFVSNPSTHGAFLSPKNEGKLNESVGTRDGVCCHDCKVENIINDIFRGE